MKFILVPIDFSAATPLVVNQAANLAGILRAHVILLYVVHVPKFPSATAEFGGRAELVDALEIAGERQLFDLKADLIRRGVNAHSLRLTGNPGTEIVDQARKLDPLCIVMGSHGHNALYDLVVGSTVSAVLKRALCPVVVVPVRSAADRTKFVRLRRRIASAVKS